MLGLETLDIAIGLILLFLSTSLLCTAIREMIEGFMKTRAADLERGIRELLRDPGGELTRTLYDHPLIYSLYEGAYIAPDQKRIFGRGGKLPSYIPSGQFAMAVLDMVAHGVTAISPYPAPVGREMSVAALKAAAAQTPNANLRGAVIAALDHANGDVRIAQANLESWFNGTMDRVSGWYKRRTQLLLLFIGLAVAAALNIDAVTIAQRLARDKALRAAVVAQAEAVIKARPDQAAPANGFSGVSSEANVENLKHQLDSIGLPMGWVNGWPAPQVVLSRLAAPVAKQCKAQPRRFECVSASFTDGAWRSAPSSDGRVYELSLGKILQIGLGWLVSAVAVTLGAPFWFDVLNKFMIVRGTVKPTEKSPDEASEDRAKPGRAAPPAAAPAAPLAAIAQPEALVAPVAGRQSAPPPAAAEGLPEPPISFESNEWLTGHAGPQEGDL